jgi:hypothetical protein
MRAAARGQWLLLQKKVDNGFQLVQVFALLPDAPHVFFKCGCREQVERHQS